MKIRRSACVVKGGRRFSFNALVVVGDRRGRVAYGYGKANEVPPAVEKAIKEGEGNVQRTKKISLRGDTIPHRVIGKYGASRVILVPAGPGTGVKAGPGVREVLQACGIANILTTIQILAAAGAQHFLVPNLANLANTPAFAGGPLEDTLSDLSNAFNANLAAQLAVLDAAIAAEITLFDLGVTNAKVAELPDGRYKVTATIATRELEASGAGEEHEVPMDVMLDVALFPAKGEELGEDDLPPPLALERRHFTGGTVTVELIAQERPAQVGIDPYSKMIDRNPDDNLKAL